MWQYVLEELNVKSVVPSNDPLLYASLRAEPDFRYFKALLFSFLQLLYLNISCVKHEIMCLIILSVSWVEDWAT